MERTPGLTTKQELEAIGALPAEMRERQLMRLAETFKEELAQAVSPPGKCRAPLVLEHPLLEERRQTYSIPDKAFWQEAVYDRVFLYQLPRHFGDKVEGSILYRPETARQRDEESTPRGIIISAGLKALDALRSNGMDIGHIVNFIRLAPWRLPYMSIKGQELTLLVLRDGDIIASEELPILRAQGKAKTVLVKDASGHPVHTLGGEYIPTKPFIPDDY